MLSFCHASLNGPSPIPSTHSCTTVGFSMMAVASSFCVIFLANRACDNRCVAYDARSLSRIVSAHSQSTARHNVPIRLHPDSVYGSPRTAIPCFPPAELPCRTTCPAWRAQTCPSPPPACAQTCPCRKSRSCWPPHQLQTTATAAAASTQTEHNTSANVLSHPSFRSTRSTGRKHPVARARNATVICWTASYRAPPNTPHLAL